MSFTAFNMGEFEAMNAAGLIKMAHRAEEAERYEDMCLFMKKRVETKVLLTSEERNLLSVAYKNVIGSRRASWRVCSAMDQDQDQEDEDKEFAVKYTKQVEDELVAICNDVLKLLQDILIPADGVKPEDLVFYLKMAGDYYRYLTEVTSLTDDYKEKCEEFYSKAQAAAKEGDLKPTHPILLGLALNQSVCFYEILRQPEKACALAKEAFDNAISQLDHLEEDDYKDATLIMQLLRDNLTLWTNNDGHADAGDGTEVHDLE